MSIPGNKAARAATALVLALATVAAVRSRAEPVTASLASAAATVSAAAAAESALSGVRFHVTNNCVATVRVAVRYRDVSGTWRTRAWYTFEPGESAYLASGGRRLKSKNAVFYFFAEPFPNGSFEWSGRASDADARTYPVDGRRLRFRHIRDRWGDNDVDLGCPARRRDRSALAYRPVPFPIPVPTPFPVPGPTLPNGGVAPGGVLFERVRP